MSVKRPSVLIILLALTRAGHAQESDRIDTRDVAGRAISFDMAPTTFRQVLSALTLVGDVNGDGISDIGLVHKSRRFPLEMIVYVIFGGSRWSGANAVPPDRARSVSFTSHDVETTGSGSPEFIPVGDLDGDGFAELAFSFDGYLTPDSDRTRGVVFIVHGAPGFDLSGELWEIGERIPGTQIFSTDPRFDGTGNFGGCVVDIDGDRNPDLVLGSNSGAVHVLLDVRDLGPRVDLEDLGDAVPGFHLTVGSLIARTFADAGDVDGDGYNDLLVGAATSNFFGYAYLFFGRPDPGGLYNLFELSETGDGVLRFEMPLVIEHPLIIFGSSRQLAGIGDLNGDGFDEDLLGESYLMSVAPGETPPESKVHLVYGGPRLASPVPIDQVPAERRTVIRGMGGIVLKNDEFGLTVSGAGDLNGDDVPDLLLGAPRRSERWTSAGEAYLLYGRRDFPHEIRLEDGFEGIRILGDHALGTLGWYLGPAGDFNADGNSDFLVGEPQTGTGGGGGYVYVILGTGDGVPPLTVVSLEPRSGFQRGGTRVRIRGSGFVEGTGVRFGGKPARRLEIVSGSELLVESPAGEAPVDVAVTVTVGGTTRTAAELFSYVADRPEIDLRAPGRWGLRVDGEAGKVIGRGLDFADLDGDGADDLLIGSDVISDWLVTVVRGGKQLPETLEAFTSGEGKTLIVKRDQTPRSFRGIRVRNAGDLNGDGIEDMAVAAELESSYLFFGRRDLEPEHDFEEEVATGGAVRLIFGATAEGTIDKREFVPLGDLTGDAVDDLAIGVSFEGVHLVAGRREWPDELDLTAPGAAFSRLTVPEPLVGVASNVANVGDVNDDGFPDLLVSGHSFNLATPVYLVFLRPAAEMPEAAFLRDYVLDGGGVRFLWEGRPNEVATIPMNVAGAGDVDGDGIDDFLIGDEKGSVSVVLQGITYLVYGRRDFPGQVTLQHDLSPLDLERIVRLGSAGVRQSSRALAGVGDYNGDGAPDFIVGAYHLDAVPPGTVDVVFGSAELPEFLELGNLGRHGFRVEGIHRVTRLEEATRAVGDLNADGAPDFAFSEWSGPEFLPDEEDLSPGSVQVVFGIPPRVDFIRGDADSDGRLNITDAVFALSYLFLGGTVPLCADAADVDDRGTVELTDAVYLLNHLFLGGDEPPAPFPLPGLDPTDEDALGCRGF